MACMGKIAASLLLKLFTSSNERCHTTDAPTPAYERNSIFKCKHIQSMIPEDQENKTTH